MQIIIHLVNSEYDNCILEVYFPMGHNTLYLPPKFSVNHCCQILLAW